MDIKDIIDKNDNSFKFYIASNIVFVFFLIWSWLSYSDDVFTIKTIKILIIFFIIRYVYSSLTTITKSDGHPYFQINNKVGIFVIVVCILAMNSHFNNKWIPLALIGGYCYIEIMSAESFTTDILTSALVGYSVFSNYKFLEYI